MVDVSDQEIELDPVSFPRSTWVVLLLKLNQAVTVSHVTKVLKLISADEPANLGFSQNCCFVIWFLHILKQPVCQ